MFFKMLNLGNMDNNCYILGDDKSKHALLIDAPAEAGAVLDVLEEEGLKLKFYPFDALSLRPYRRARRAVRGDRRRGDDPRI